MMSSRAVAGIAAPWRLGLSGTVLQHSPLNAYGVYRALDPAILGTSYTRFKLQFTAPCSWGEQDGLEMGRGGALTPYRFVNLDELHRKMMSIGYQVKYCFHPLTKGCIAHNLPGLQIR